MRAFDIIEHPTFEVETSLKEQLILGAAGIAAAIASTAVAMQLRGAGSLFDVIDSFALNR
ncbi:uncharacterized protein FIBRA_06092 [Fibroporia radiculosa]|uniref:Uncharacterized protein n=1 Tax=Fibroporia radiculosa TaxID=599839 RepID=J4H3W2_9APHY|nr:uncharacterized protein FIBRA_06092 [Fibroporia radiculosa]CCM03939.1 predicted protein [Fibroporia radiculosa]